MTTTPQSWECPESEISLFWLSRWGLKHPALFLDRPVPFYAMTLAGEELQLFVFTDSALETKDLPLLQLQVPPSHLSWPYGFKGHLLPKITCPSITSLGGHCCKFLIRLLKMVQLIALSVQLSTLLHMLNKTGINATNVPKEVPSPPQAPEEGANVFKTPAARHEARFTA